MKKTLLLALLVAVPVAFSFGQNTFPSSGNVGIGTTNPTNKLDIVGGNLSIYNSGSSTSIAIGSTSSGKTNLIMSTSADGNGYGAINAISTSGSAWGNLVLEVNGGNVGIGTSVPNGKLQVVGSSIFNGYPSNLDYSVFPNISYLANSAQMLIGWNRTGGNGEADFISNRAGGGSGGYAFYDYSNSGVESQLLRILGNGNVGIGQFNPQNKLDVAGTVHSQAVKVDMNGWSDKVFAKRYNLPALTYVADYINKNHHLSDIPSEEQVLKNGIDIGEMNKILLQKVEELTLYLIKQDKEIKSQRTEIIRLKMFVNHFNK